MSLKEAFGVFQRHGDHIDVRFERYYPRPVAKVWSAITEPERLKDWMGAAYVEPHVGGRFDLMIDGPRPMTGRVRVWRPPDVLEIGWSNAHAPESVVRFELTPEGDGAKLVFTHRRMPYASSALMLRGWHVYLGRLGSLLAETPDANPTWRETQAVYVEHYRLLDVTLDP